MLQIRMMMLGTEAGTTSASTAAYEKAPSIRNNWIETAADGGDADDGAGTNAGNALGTVLVLILALLVVLLMISVMMLGIRLLQPLMVITLVNAVQGTEAGN